MTEGIIQEVFRKEIEYWQTCILGETYDKNIKIYQSQIKRIEALRSEVIERIKLEFPIEYPFSHVYGTPRIQAKLIGDSKE